MNLGWKKYGQRIDVGVWFASSKIAREISRNL